VFIAGNRMLTATETIVAQKICDTETWKLEILAKKTKITGNKKKLLICIHKALLYNREHKSNNKNSG
jgi:hypothetical protein